MDSPDLTGYLCEQCLDAPAVAFVAAPWGGEMGVCAPCGGLEPAVPSAAAGAVSDCPLCTQPPGRDERHRWRVQALLAEIARLHLVHGSGLPGWDRQPCLPALQGTDHLQGHRDALPEVCQGCRIEGGRGPVLAVHHLHELGIPPPPEAGVVEVHQLTGRVDEILRPGQAQERAPPVVKLRLFHGSPLLCHASRPFLSGCAQRVSSVSIRASVMARRSMAWVLWPALHAAVGEHRPER